MRDQLDADASEAKDSQSAVIELSRRYGNLSPDEKVEVDNLLAEWVLSDDGRLRFDALALIRDHSIRSSLPSLRTLQDRLERATEPSAPYEWAKVNRLIGHLVEAKNP